MKPKSLYYLMPLVVLSTATLTYYSVRGLPSSPKSAPGSTLARLVDLADNPLNENRLEEAIGILMRGENIDTQQGFEKTFGSFERQQLSEDRSFNTEPPLDYQHCYH